MRFWILLLTFSTNTFAMGPADLNFAPQEQRLTQCMGSLGTSFGQSFSGKVISVGPSLRKIFPGLTVKNAIVVMDVSSNDRHTLVLRQVSKQSLQKSTKTSFNVSAGELLFFNLNDSDHYDFEVDSKQIGSITLTFDSHETSQNLNQMRPGVILTGSIMKINKEYFVVVNKTTGTFSEQGVRPRSTYVYHLASFTERPLAGKVSGNKIHRLEVGGFWGYELNGRQVTSIENLGRAVIDVKQRIGETPDPSFSTTIVQWSEENAQAAKVLVPKIRIENFQALTTANPRLIESNPNLASILETDANLKRLLEKDRE